MYVYICVHVNVCECACICVYLWVCVYMCVYVCICVYMCICVYVCPRVCVCVCTAVVMPDSTPWDIAQALTAADNNVEAALNMLLNASQRAQPHAQALDKEDERIARELEAADQRAVAVADREAEVETRALIAQLDAEDEVRARGVD